MDAEKVNTFLKDLSIWGKKIGLKGCLKQQLSRKKLNLTKTDTGSH